MRKILIGNYDSEGVSLSNEHIFTEFICPTHQTGFLGKMKGSKWYKDEEGTAYFISL